MLRVLITGMSVVDQNFLVDKRASFRNVMRRSNSNLAVSSSSLSSSIRIRDALDVCYCCSNFIIHS